jgi:ferredoxin
MKNILIAYFTGTGGTEMVVKELEKRLDDMGCSVETFPIDLSKIKSLDAANDRIKETDRLVVAYPVYSYDAPLPVHRWIDGLEKADGTKASVLSISAGGVVPSNRTCRKHCIEHLEEKGFTVDYERMITMPSNYAGTASEDINILLIKAVPLIAHAVANDILNDVVHTEKKAVAILPLIAAKAFGGFAKDFGKKLRITDDCTDCKWCEKNCPTNNLTINDGQISASDHCTLCLRCVYGCPAKALYSKSYNFSVIKEGFSIKELKKKADSTENIDVSAINGGKLWKGAEEYLKEVFEN